MKKILRLAAIALSLSGAALAQPVPPNLLQFGGTVPQTTDLMAVWRGNFWLWTTPSLLLQSLGQTGSGAMVLSNSPTITSATGAAALTVSHTGSGNLLMPLVTAAGTQSTLKFVDGSTDTFGFIKNTSNDLLLWDYTRSTFWGKAFGASGNVTLGESTNLQLAAAGGVQVGTCPGGAPAAGVICAQTGMFVYNATSSTTFGITHSGAGNLAINYTTAAGTQTTVKFVDGTDDSYGFIKSTANDFSLWDYLHSHQWAKVYGATGNVEIGESANITATPSGGVQIGSCSGGDHGAGTLCVQNSLYQLFPRATKTTAYTVLASESGMHYSNAGATGTVTYTLPAGFNGGNYCFSSTVAAKTVTIVAAVGGVIALGATANNSISMTGQYGKVCIDAETSTLWIVRSSNGSWS